MTIEQYPHILPHTCGDCAQEGKPCDDNDNHLHVFIRLMGSSYLSCMYCGRWERLRVGA